MSQQQLLNPPLRSPPFLNSKVLFVAKKNARKRWFIPSTDNMINGIRHRDVMVDPGCNSILIPLHGPEELNYLREELPHNRFSWDVTEGAGAGVTSLILDIRSLSDPTLSVFAVQLGRDLGAGICYIPKLRFHLCSEDVSYLVEHMGYDAFGAFFDDISAAILTSTAIPTEPRRHRHVIIGQSVLHQCRSFDDLTYLYVFEPGAHLTHTFATALEEGTLTSALNIATATTQADDFNELEDEEHLYEESFVDEEGEDTGDEEY